MSEDASDRRHPHQSFDPELIRRFLDGRRIVSAQLLREGKSNSNYRLALSDGLVCVLRLHSRGDAGREAYVMSLVRELVPVPAPIASGPGWSVSPFLKGEHLSDVPQQTAAAAAALARIHSVRFDSCGWIEADGTLSDFPFEAEGGFLEKMFADERVKRWISAENIKAIRRILQREGPRMAEMSSDCRLVHGDFNPTNVLIRNGEVSGILDWEFAHANTPWMDIGNLLRNTDERHHGLIARGLLSGGMNLPGDWKDRAALIDLGSHLEFLTTDRSDAFKRTRVALINAFLEQFSRH